jgi:hypothetical protein
VPSRRRSGQLAFGVHALLARLRARVSCRAILFDLLYRDGEERPPSFSAAELTALGITTPA